MAIKTDITVKIEIFDPPMCCPTGLCGPALDPVLLRLDEAIRNLQKTGEGKVNIFRYALNQQPKAFLDNNLVKNRLHQKGRIVLPLTLVNGELKKEAQYPTPEELNCWAFHNSKE